MKNLTERLPRDLLKWTAAGFALVATATAEYEIARAIGMNEWIAAAVPGALDAYVVRALRTHREVLTSVVAMVGVNAASHLVTAGILPVEWPLITAVSAIAPLVLWRVHALGTPGEARRRLIWGLPWRARTVEHTSTEPEHSASTPDLDVPDWVKPPSTPVLDVPESVPVMHVQRVQTDEHTSTLDPDPALLPEVGNPVMRARHLEVVKEHTSTPVCSDCGHIQHNGGFACEPGCFCPGDWKAAEHTASTCLDPELCTRTDPCPVCDPDEHADEHASTRHLRLVHGGFDSVHAAEHAPDPVCPACKHDAHTALACDSAFCGCAHRLPEPEHTASTRTADDWNLEHVSTGTLTPEDTEHMERARELFHTIGGVPPFRALKHGTPGMGTDRAKRIRAALKIENEGTD